MKKKIVKPNKTKNIDQKNISLKLDKLDKDQLKKLLITTSINKKKLLNKVNELTKTDHCVYCHQEFNISKNNDKACKVKHIPKMKTVSVHFANPSNEFVSTVLNGYTQKLHVTTPNVMDTYITFECGCHIENLWSNDFEYIIRKENQNYHCIDQVHCRVGKHMSLEDWKKENKGWWASDCPCGSKFDDVREHKKECLFVLERGYKERYWRGCEKCKL